MTIITPIMLWGIGDNAVISFLRCWRVFHSIRNLRLGDNFLPHISGKTFRFYTNKEQGYATVTLLESALACSGMECGINEGKENINARSVELQMKFP
ncbi:MAG: hypothetical protein A3G17_04920 [Planctomycetes bacterium RIFCSPLOWO2_12_FULL_50_35]|jgi:hypothetical protein|uniref:hypothetical protein n=1 Tax=Candidatus Avalokitesvara rifleensis TaxID=3367620 RepID=UPI0008C2BA0A|nr:hypothetical protein [Candidatus Brocadiales bacterium]OHB91559.1 MAG: hypothetical protein A3E75_00165 [Planctomycetes bacterium RIFCSPHIGHO2_12_FULL_51_37]OHC05273.1 MAG: hypothetical protein A3G17_04920 [Planctomycetes bacterium RIFCSPLOWO2_12_FULL_50_35]HCN19246.1 hypothetical protein [Planctomycetia bacterium]